MKKRNTSSLPKVMTEKLLREIADEYLLPLFSGASIDAISDSSSSSEATVAYIDPQTIGFKVNKSDTYRLKFRRDQPFAQKQDPARELRVVEAFTSILAEMNDELKGELRSDLLSTFQRRVVARAVSDFSHDQQILTLLDQTAKWAERLYEGDPISGAIGFDPYRENSTGEPLDVFGSHDFGAVLSNGYNSLLAFGAELRFIDHHVLQSSGFSARGSPWMQAPIACWTAGKGRVAVALNRHGEILVFRDGQLLFARRNGNWHFLTHSPILGQMVVPRDPEIRGAIYASVLDASFERKGACIGIVGSGQSDIWQSLVSPADRVDHKNSERARALSGVIRGRPFQDLERTLRLELISIDGATLINHKGEILAVGSIVQISSSGTGGGRTAAAQELAKVGLGIKISQDGSISGYRPKSAKSSKVSLAFSLM
ncbi:hypothetical protein [uncultured Litoreibacter sp.]|uniref:hypothetical protein n=1 Tax=uncultured Litoreibacter sp. TaxID=1392394 RepID=UPI0026264F84|nr:hypothetical protein [uncultured Litoreibacter sp.]